MATHRERNDEVDKLVTVKVGGKARKMFADCAGWLCEEGEIVEASEWAMGYQGRC
jgi:hypothetical protein